MSGIKIEYIMRDVYELRLGNLKISLPADEVRDLHLASAICCDNDCDCYREGYADYQAGKEAQP